MLSLIWGDLSPKPVFIYSYMSSKVIEAVIAFNVAKVSSTIIALLSFNFT